MAKVVDVSVADAALNQFKGNTTGMSACGTTPTTMAQATATYSLGTLAIATTVWTVGAATPAEGAQSQIGDAAGVSALAAFAYVILTARARNLTLNAPLRYTILTAKERSMLLDYSIYKVGYAIVDKCKPG
jgi:hypothetical protein